MEKTPAAEGAPVTAAASASDATDLVFRALASPTRREILAVLQCGAHEDDPRCCSPDGVCACVLVERLGIGAPTVSHHMKSLVEAGLVTAKKRGVWVYYRVRTDALDDAIAQLALLTGRRIEQRS